MKISEQLREAALYADDPFWDVDVDAIKASFRYEDPGRLFIDEWKTLEGRTWLLFMAEALQ